MKQLFTCSTIALTALSLIGCVKENREIPANYSMNATSDVTQRSDQNKKPGLSTVVSLDVIIQNEHLDDFGNTLHCKIKSEDGRIYSDGVDYVRAVIDQNGTFVFNTNTSKGLAKRFVVYDLSDPVDPTNSYNPGFSTGSYSYYNFIFSTGSTSYGTTPFIPLQNLAIGQSEYIYLNGNINGDKLNSIFKYTVSFHAAKEDNLSTPTAFAKVERLSEVEWKITPGSPTESYNDIAGLRTGDTRNEVFKGYYHLPFSFILKKK